MTRQDLEEHQLGRFGGDRLRAHGGGAAIASRSKDANRVSRFVELSLTDGLSGTETPRFSPRLGFQVLDANSLDRGSQ